MDNEDPLHQSIVDQVEIMLRKLPIGTSSGDSFTLEGSEKVSSKNFIGESSDKSVLKKEKKYSFNFWKKNMRY